MGAPLTNPRRLSELGWRCLAAPPSPMPILAEYLKRGKKDASQVRVLLVIICFGNNLPARGFPRIRSLSRKAFRRACPNPRAPRDSGAMVAHRLPKPRVAGSSPVYRSHLRCFHRCKIKLKVSVTPLNRDGVVGNCGESQDRWQCTGVRLPLARSICRDSVIIG